MRYRTALDSARVAATFAGTLIGAGFASGQEVMQFFISHGPAGLIGIMVSGAAFAWFGARILELGHRLNAVNGYHRLLYHVCGRGFGQFLDILTTVFLFSGYSVMLAGAAGVGRDFFHLPYTAGLAAFALLTSCTVLCGMGGIMAANDIVTPLLIVLIAQIGISSLDYHGPASLLLRFAPRPELSPTSSWLLSSLLYASYNLLLAATVLAPLGAHTSARRVRKAGGILGGITLMVMALFVAIVILLHYPEAAALEVPMLHVAATQTPWKFHAYAATLLAAMFTTAIASLYGCSNKLKSITGLSGPARIALVLIPGAACGQIGFTGLIALLYPFFGYAALIFILGLAWDALRDN